MSNVGPTAKRPRVAFGESWGWRKKFCMSTIMYAVRFGSMMAVFRMPSIGMVLGEVTAMRADRVRSQVEEPASTFQKL